MKRHSEVPRFSGTEELIFQMLSDNPTEEMYGLQMVQRSDGQLSRGTIYVLLDRMEEKGFISSHPEQKQPGEIGPPRRRYSPTEYGKHVYHLWGELRALAQGKTQQGRAAAFA